MWAFDRIRRGRLALQITPEQIESMNPLPPSFPLSERYPACARWRVVEPGRMAYTDALALQHRLVRARHAKVLASDLLILLEHPPVFTLGRRGGRENLRVSSTFLGQSGIPIIQAERGGNITFHGPGQLVAYLIMDLGASKMSVEDLVGRLEKTMIRTARSWGIEAGLNPSNRGIWVGNSKLGSIGIAIRKGVTYHGLALNVDLSLEPFGWINPCGLQNVSVTSMQQASENPSLSMRAVQPMFKHHFESVFASGLNPMTMAELESALQMPPDDFSASGKRAPGFFEEEKPQGRSK
jgi:lipoate-protein ligase B